jgi:hypothetical protein
VKSASKKAGIEENRPFLSTKTFLGSLPIEDFPNCLEVLDLAVLILEAF